MGVQQDERKTREVVPPPRETAKKQSTSPGKSPGKPPNIAPAKFCKRERDEFVHHPDWLMRPLKRLRGSREREFAPVSWHQAVTEIAATRLELRRIYGPDSRAFFSSSCYTNEENYLVQKLARIVIGTNNRDNCARLCHSTTGSGVMTNSITDIEAAGCIFILGSNTTEAHPLTGKKVLAIQKRGASVIDAAVPTVIAKNREALRHLLQAATAPIASWA